MAEGKGIGTADRYFGKVSDWLGKRISAFVAFLFILFGAGALYGAVLVPRYPEYGIYFLGAPLLLALVAYYNRAAATILFVGILLAFIL